MKAVALSSSDTLTTELLPGELASTKATSPPMAEADNDTGEEALSLEQIIHMSVH